MMDPDFDRLRMVLLREEEPDRVPFFEIYADKEVMEAITREPVTQMDLSDENVQQLYLEAAVKFYRGLGYDYVSLRSSPDFPRNNILFTEDMANLNRGKREWLDEQRGSIRDQLELEKYPWPNPDDLVDRSFSHLRILRRFLQPGMKVIPYTSGIFENMTRLLGTVPFLHKLYREPSFIQDAFDKVGSVISVCLEAISAEDDVGAIAYNDDMGYKVGPIMSPQLFRRYVFPWQKRCVERVHKSVKPFILHSCGNLRLLMDDLITYVGIDAKHSYEDSTYPVTLYKKLYGDRIAILGGVDMDKIAREPLSEFEVYVRDVIRECAPGGGYALGCGNTVANYVNPENYLAMLEIGRKYGKYPMRYRHSAVH